MYFDLYIIVVYLDITIICIWTRMTMYVVAFSCKPLVTISLSLLDYDRPEFFFGGLEGLGAARVSRFITDPFFLADQNSQTPLL